VSAHAALLAPVRRLPPLVVLAAALVLALLAAAGVKSHQDLAAARGRESTLRASIASTEASVRDLRRRVERLRDDPVLLERIAREDLGWIRPGDVVVVFPDRPR
jgi:cell division protein FtsB